MARVMFYTGLSMLGISAVLLYLPICFSYILAAVFLVGFIFLTVFKRFIKVNGLKLLALFCCAFCLVGIFTINNKVKPAEGLSGNKAKVVCTVTDYPEYHDDYTVYTVKTESIKPIKQKGKEIPSNIPQNLKLRLTDINGFDFKVFDKIELEVTFNSLGEFKSSSLGNGVYVGGYADKLVGRLGENRPFYAVFYDFREYLNTLIYDNVNYEDATVISAAVLGDMDRLDDGFYANAKAAGVSHVLVVSGMHLGIVFQVLSALLGFLGVRGKKFALILMASVFAVVAICGFTPSILRAGLTYFILALGMLFYKRPDPLNSLGLAAVIILFASPFSFGNISLLLSLAATFGLLYLCPFFYVRTVNFIGRKFNVGRILKAVLFSVIQTLSATIITMPICIAYFGYISLVTVFANIAVGYPTTLMLSLSVLTLFLLMLPSFLKTAATIPIILICFLSRYTVSVTNFFGSIDWAVAPMHSSFLWVWFVFIALLFCIMIWLTLKEVKLKYKIMSFVFLGVVTVVASLVCYISIPKDRFAVLKVGNGSSVVVCYNDSVYVIGAGDGKSDASTIESYLLSIGKRKIDYLILPTLSKAYAGGAAALDFNMDIARVVTPEKGDYAAKIKHISDESYSFYNEYAVISLDDNGAKIFIYENGGCIVETADNVFVIKCGDLKISSLGENNHKLLVTDVLPDGDILKNDFDSVIISGREENAKNIKNSSPFFNDALFSDKTREFTF